MNRVIGFLASSVVKRAACQSGRARATLAVMCRSITTPRDRFLREANNNLAWLEHKLSLLRPDNSDYESEKRSIESATRELQELMQIVNSRGAATVR
jgi:hypothetical protein